MHKWSSFPWVDDATMQYHDKEIPETVGMATFDKTLKPMAL